MDTCNSHTCRSLQGAAIQNNADICPVFAVQPGAWSCLKEPFVLKTVPIHTDTVVVELPQEIVNILPTKLALRIITDISKNDNITFTYRTSHLDIYTKQGNVKHSKRYIYPLPRRDFAFYSETITIPFTGEKVIYLKSKDLNGELNRPGVQFDSSITIERLKF